MQFKGTVYESHSLSSPEIAFIFTSHPKKISLALVRPGFESSIEVVLWSSRLPEVFKGRCVELALR